MKAEIRRAELRTLGEEKKPQTFKEGFLRGHKDPASPGFLEEEAYR